MMRLLLVALVFALAAVASAAPPKDPQVEAQLHALFNTWDLNHDEFLDRDELAKHFRGAKAVSPKGGMYDDKGNLTPLYHQARTKYPDLIFLWSLDKDLDGRVNWTEFEQYGQAYAAVLKQQLQSRQKLVLAQQQMLRRIYSQANRNVHYAQHRRTNYVRHAYRHYSRPQRHAVRRYTRHAPRGRGGRTNYVRNAYNSYAAAQRHAVQQYVRNVQNYQRQAARVRGEVMRNYRSALERQRGFYQMALRQRQRWLQQYQSYLRSRIAYAHRMPVRHFYPVYRHAYRR